MKRGLWVVLLAGGLLGAWALRDRPVLVIVLLGLVLTVAWFVSPRTKMASHTQAEMLALPDDERKVVVYWRPGCVFCQRLRAALGRDGKKAVWVNIWDDPEAAAFVRSVNEGNEVVPTVLLDGVPHTNPEPRLVRATLTG